MRAEKLSISLTSEPVALIEAYRAAHSIKSRSRVIKLALCRLREEDLESAYRKASAEAGLEWDVTTGDGLADEAW